MNRFISILLILGTAILAQAQYRVPGYVHGYLNGGNTPQTHNNQVYNGQTYSNNYGGSDNSSTDINFVSKETYHGMLAADIGFNGDGYEVGLSVSYWPVSTFGLKMGIGVAGEYSESIWYDYYDYGYGYGYGYGYDIDYGYYDNDYAIRFKFMPSIELRSPSLGGSSDDNISIHLFANPGLTLSPGASGSHDAKWLTWQVRGGLELDIDNFVAQLGYGYSTFNLYSGCPYSHYDYDTNPERKTHTGFLTLGFRF